MYQLALLSSFLALFLLASETPKDLQKPISKPFVSCVLCLGPSNSTPDEVIEGECRYAIPIEIPTLSKSLEKALNEKNPTTKVQFLVAIAKARNDIMTLLEAASRKCLADYLMKKWRYTTKNRKAAESMERSPREPVVKAIAELLADPENRAKLRHEHLSDLGHLIVEFRDEDLAKAVLSCDHLQLIRLSPEAFQNIVRCGDADKVKALLSCDHLQLAQTHYNVFRNIIRFGDMELIKAVLSSDDLESSRFDRKTLRDLSIVLPPQQLVRYIHPDTVDVPTEMELAEPLYCLEYMFSVPTLSGSEASAKICKFFLKKFDANDFYMIPENQDRLVKIFFKLPNLFDDINKAVINIGKCDHLKELFTALKPVMANWITQCTSFLKMGGNRDILEILKELLITSLDLPFFKKSSRLHQQNRIRAPHNPIALPVLGAADLKTTLKRAIKAANLDEVRQLLPLILAKNDITMILDTLKNISFYKSDRECVKAVIEAAVQLLADPEIREAIPNNHSTVQLITRCMDYPAMVQSLVACENLDLSSQISINLPLICEVLAPQQLAHRVKITDRVMNLLYFKQFPIYALEYAYYSDIPVEKWIKYLVQLTDTLKPTKFYAIKRDFARLLFLLQAHFLMIYEAVMIDSNSNVVKQFFDFMAEVMETAELVLQQLNLCDGSEEIYGQWVTSFIETFDFPVINQADDDKCKEKLFKRQNCIRAAKMWTPQPQTLSGDLDDEPTSEPSPVEMNALLLLLSIMQQYPDLFQMN